MAARAKAAADTPPETDPRKPAVRVRAGALLAALKDVLDVVPGKDTIPILNDVRLAAGEGRIELTATNLDIWAVRELASADGDAGPDRKAWLESIRPFAIALPAKVLGAVLREIDGEAMVTLTAPQANEARAELRAGRAGFKLACLPVDEFPLPPPVDVECGFSMPCGQLADAFAAVAHAVSTEETRYYLNGVYLHVWQAPGEAQELRLAATDGHRLTRLTLDPPEGAASFPALIVHRETVKLLGKLCAEAVKAGEKAEGDTAAPEIGIDVAEDGRLLYFQLPASDGGDIAVTAKTIDGQFPDYARVIPSAPPHRAVLDRAALAEALRRVGTLAGDKTRAVRATFSASGNGGGKLALLVRSPEHGEASEEIEADYSGPEWTLGFNGVYWREALAALPHDQVAMEFAEDTAAPVRLAGWLASGSGSGGAETGALLQVLMPMRVA